MRTSKPDIYAVGDAIAVTNFVTKQEAYIPLSGQMCIRDRPGSYIVATENSYVGSLVKLAGGVNVYQGTDQEFLNANTEDMQSKDPDIIVRAAHALPDDVVEMFKEEFETNDIWKHFRAVQEGRVYDLSYDKFGMSAKFNYPEALEELQPMLYGEDS